MLTTKLSNDEQMREEEISEVFSLPFAARCCALSKIKTYEILSWSRYRTYDCNASCQRVCASKLFFPPQNTNTMTSEESKSILESGGQVSITFRVKCPLLSYGQAVYLCREDNEDAMSSGRVSYEVT